MKFQFVFICIQENLMGDTMKGAMQRFHDAMNRKLIEFPETVNLNLSERNVTFIDEEAP